MDEECGYDTDSIATSATLVESLIENEKSLIGGDASKVYLAGFSQGGQMTGYMQLSKLTYALGGTIIMNSFPLPPLSGWDVDDQSAAQSAATYYGDDMNWMIHHSTWDYVFQCKDTMKTWRDALDAVGARSTLKLENI